MLRSFYGYPAISLGTVLNSPHSAEAQIRGGKDFPMIHGTAKLYQTDRGVIVYCEIHGLPRKQSPCGGPIFALHIHEGTSCQTGPNGDFLYAKTHYDPVGCEHPHHAGDLPPLFSNHGYALSAFLTDRFTVKDVIGRIFIIHEHTDDFTTQPSGNAGKMIACGEIKKEK